MTDGIVLQCNASVVQPDQACRAVARGRREDVKLERSPGWNLVRAKRLEFCNYASVEKCPVKKVIKLENVVGNTLFVCINSVAAVANAFVPDDYSREHCDDIGLVVNKLRKYWKHYAPRKWFKQAKASGKVNNTRANLLFDYDVKYLFWIPPLLVRQAARLIQARNKSAWVVVKLCKPLKGAPRCRLL